GDQRQLHRRRRRHAAVLQEHRPHELLRADQHARRRRQQGELSHPLRLHRRSLRRGGGAHARRRRLQARRRLRPPHRLPAQLRPGALQPAASESSVHPQADLAGELRLRHRRAGDHGAEPRGERPLPDRLPHQRPGDCRALARVRAAARALPDRAGRRRAGRRLSLRHHARQLRPRAAAQGVGAHHRIDRTPVRRHEIGGHLRRPTWTRAAVLDGAGRGARLGAAAIRRLQRAAAQLALHHHAKRADADQQPGAVQRRRPQPELEHPPALGVHRRQRAVRGLQRRPQFGGPRFSRSDEPDIRDQGDAPGQVLKHTMSPMPNLLSKEHIIAPPGFNRWLVPPAALAIHLSIGMAYGFSVFWLPLSRAIGVTAPAPGDWKISTLGWMYTLFFVMLGSSAALFGPWVEREGPRKAGVVAACCWGGGFFIAAAGVYFHQIALLWIGSGVIGGCGLGLGYISPVSTLIKWFPDRRGMATGLAIMGFGGGAMIGTPLADLLMRRFATATSVGVWQTFVVMGAVYFAAMMLGAFGYRLPPPGWTPAGWTPPRDEAAQAGVVR